MFKYIKFKRNQIALLLIISLAILFRFYNFLNLQYWSGDEEMLVATIRHMVWDKSPSILVQNANLGFGLGPFYHFLLVPFFIIFKFDLTKLMIIPSILGVITTYIVYSSGKTLKGEKLGQVAALIYACSFLISLFDRRLYHLTLNSALAALTFLCLSKVIKKDYRFLPVLALPVGFTFHSDPSLAVLTIAIAIAWFVFKFKPPKKYILYFLLIIGLFSLPIFAAEIHYNGAVSKPFLHSLTKPLREESTYPADFHYLTPLDFVSIYARTIFTRPSNHIDGNFCYCPYTPPMFSPLTQIIAAIILATSAFLFIRKKTRDKFSTLIWILMFSFFFGIFTFNVIFKGVFHQHYFTVIFPIFALLTAQVFLLYFNKRNLILLAATFYFVFNFYTLINSSVSYPLYKKEELVKKSLDYIGDKQFSLYASKDPYIEGGGWTELYTLTKHPPVKSYWYGYWDWIYRAYSLFPGPIQNNDPGIIVWVGKSSENSPLKLPIKKTLKDSGLKIYIFDNSEQGNVS